MAKSLFILIYEVLQNNTAKKGKFEKKKHFFNKNNFQNTRAIKIILKISLFVFESRSKRLAVMDIYSCRRRVEYIYELENIHFGIATHCMVNQLQQIALKNDH